MNTNTRLAKNPLCTARTRRVLLTGIASLLAGAGLHTHAAEAVFSSISLGGGDQDANVGLSATETYHSAANFSGGALTINGVAFEAGAGGDPINGANWSLTGAGGVFGGFSSGVDGQIGTMLSDFSYGGNPATFTLNNLTVGQTYVLTSYNGQFGGAGGRVTTVTGSSGPSTVYDENISSGLNLLRYTFTAAATSEALTFSPHSAGDTWHFYGFSNEQVFNNTWTSGADWTTAGWSVAAPNGVGTNADFTAQGTPTALNLDAARTVGHVRFDGANAWTLSTNNASTLTLQADAGGVSVLSATSGAHTISAPVQLNSAVMKFGAGSVRLTGAIAGSGKGITVSTGALVFETATADLTSVGSIANNGALSFINAGAQSYGGFITGTGGLTKSGAGTLTLGAAETYGGSTVISGGTLKLGPTVHVTFSNPGFETFDPLASGSYGYSPTGASWTFGGNAGISLNGGPFFDPTNHEGSAGGFIQGSGGGISQTVTVTQAGSYTFNFQGVSRAGGGPNGIVFQVDGTAVRTIDPGELSQATWQNYSASITLAAGSHTIAFVGNNVLGGDRSSVVDAVAGTTGGVLPSGTALSLTTTGAALDLSGNDQTLGSLAGVAGTNVQNIGAFTAGGDGTSTAFAGVISGAGSFTKAGNGVLTLSAANSYGGSTTISGGTLRTTGGSLPANTALSLTSATSVFDMNGVSHTLGSLSGAAGSSVLLGGGTLAAGNNNASTTFAGNITGAGSITKEGNGTLILSGGTGHNYSGNTTVSGGTLVSDTQNAGTTGLATIAGGATWDLGTASHTVIGLTGGGNITRNGLLSTGADGAALISPANNYLLKLDFGGGGNGGATVNGVTFDDIPTTSGGNWSLSGAGVQFGEGNISGLHSGYEQLVDDFYYNGSPGVLTLSGLTPGQTYNAVLYTKVGLWPSRPQNATFATGTASAQLLGTDPGTVGYYAYKFIADTTSMSVTMAPTQVNATFHWFAASLESLSTTTATLTIGDAGNYSFSGAINGGTKLIKQGAGTQELSGASNYSGGTNITAGAILSHNATGVGTGPVSVASGANYLAWWNTGSPLITNSFTLNGPGGNAGDGLKDAIYADGGGAGFAEYTITGNVTLNATSNIGGNNLNNLRVTGQITGPGGLTKGSGRADENNTLILANPANDYAGDTFITRGTVRLAASEVIPHGAGKGGVTIATGATLDLGGFHETINRLSGTGTITTTASPASIGLPVYFNNDAGTGISAAKTYTHALDFAEGTPVSVNGVTFLGAGLSGANWLLDLGPNPGAAGSGNTGATGDISRLLTNFFYNGNPATLTLTGLTPGVNYETRLYERQWGGDRTQLFTITSGAATANTVFDEDASATPSYLPLRYTADATGTATITTNQIGAGTYHWYGLTNEVVSLPKLTVGDATDSTFSGDIVGALEIEKIGAGMLTLDGVTLNFQTLTTNDGVTNLNRTLGTGTSTINANATTHINASQTLAALNIADGVVVTFGDGLALVGAPEKFGSSAAVPEPGSMTLLLGGLAALLGGRRRKA